MGSFTTSDGITLHHETEGAGPAVLLLHGLSSSITGNWRQPGIWQQLVDAGRTVHGLDLRGHGQSDKPHDPDAYASGALARDVTEFAAELQTEGEPIDLVGYSMGAMTALRAVATGLGVRKLVLGGIGGDPEAWRSQGMPTSPSAVLSKPEVLSGLEAAHDSEVTDPDARRIRQLMLSRGNDPVAIAALLRGLRLKPSGLDLSNVTAPTLVLCGDSDFDPFPLAAALPNARAELVPGDHEGAVTEPMLAKAIVSFLDA